MANKPQAERLDRFELIAELASGGMATVYLARLGGAGGFQRLFAIKRLHPHLARDREFIEMFLDEARLAARIHHPNVVPIQEIGTSDAGYYLVMDYIEGDTEARLFAKSSQLGTKIAPNVGIRIALDVLAGLHASHELRDVDGKPLEIVHRDVSPQNILVGVDGIARITDFGVARAASRLSTTRTGQLKGKLAYMAPEQARSKAHVDRRADVFAMGIVLWETLAFRRLFKGDSEAETLNRVMYEPIPTLRSAVPTIPASLDALVMKALERDPEKRFQSAAELGDALEKAAQSLKVLGTQRDVAACVNDVIGTEVEAQREAVRAWLARSEPSRNDSRDRLKIPGESVTKIERAGTSLTPPPTNVSDLSTAAVHVPPEPPSSGAMPAAGAVIDESQETTEARRTRKRRARTWSAALGAASLVIAWGVVAWKSAPPASVAGGPHANASPPMNAGATNANGEASANAQPPSTGVAAKTNAAEARGAPGAIDARDAGTDAASKAAPAPAPRRHRPASIAPAIAPAADAPAAPPPAAAPADTASEPAVPDDITRNPYR